MKKEIKMKLMMWMEVGMTKMLSGANLPPIEALMDGDLQEWQGAPATTLGAATLYWIPVATHSLKL